MLISRGSVFHSLKAINTEGTHCSYFYVTQKGHLKEKRWRTRRVSLRFIKLGIKKYLGHKYKVIVMVICSKSKKIHCTPLHYLKLRVNLLLYLQAWLIIWMLFLSHIQSEYIFYMMLTRVNSKLTYMLFRP